MRKLSEAEIVELIRREISYEVMKKQAFAHLAASNKAKEDAPEAKHATENGVPEYLNGRRTYTGAAPTFWTAAEGPLGDVVKGKEIVIADLRNRIKAAEQNLADSIVDIKRSERHASEVEDELRKTRLEYEDLKKQAIQRGAMYNGDRREPMMRAWYFPEPTTEMLEKNVAIAVRDQTIRSLEAELNGMREMIGALNEVNDLKTKKISALEDQNTMLEALRAAANTMANAIHRMREQRTTHSEDVKDLIADLREWADPDSTRTPPRIDLLVQKAIEYLEHPVYVLAPKSVMPAQVDEILGGLAEIVYQHDAGWRGAEILRQAKDEIKSHYAKDPK